MNNEVLIWFVVFTRAGALLAVLPGFSGQAVPVQLRLGLAALTAFLTAPFIPAPIIATPAFWSLLKLLFVEASTGLLLGFIGRMVFYALDLAGGMIATEMGLMLSSNFNPLTSAALPIPGTILFWMAMMLLFTLNLHHWVMLGFQKSYFLLPPGGAHLSQPLAVGVIGFTSQTFHVALLMAAPIVAVSFVISLLFAVLSRAVPQMNVFGESFPVRSLAGLAVFGFTCHLLAEHMENCLRRLPDDILRIAQLLGMA